MRRRDGLLGRRRLARKDGLVTLEAVHLQQPQVGGHDVAEAQTDDIAGHELDDVDLLQAPVALHKSRAADLRVERLDGLLGAVLVDEAEHDADAEDGDDDARLSGVPDDGGDDRGPQQERQQEAAQLPAEHAPDADAVAAQGVGTDRLQPSSRLLAGQAVGARSQSLEDLIRRQRGSLGESERAPAVRRGRSRPAISLAPLRRRWRGERGLSDGRAHRDAALTMSPHSSPETGVHVSAPHLAQLSRPATVVQGVGCHLLLLVGSHSISLRRWAGCQLSLRGKSLAAHARRSASQARALGVSAVDRRSRYVRHFRTTCLSGGHAQAARLQSFPRDHEWQPGQPPAPTLSSGLTETVRAPR